MSGNKIPSLINGSAGRPKIAIALKKCPCRGCGQDILKGQECFDIPNPRSSFSSSKRYCKDCFQKIIAKTKQDIVSFETMV